MRRRDFNLAALAAASVTACGGGGGGGGSESTAPAPSAAPGSEPLGGTVSAPAPAPVPVARTAIGTNLPGMELTGDSAIRFGGSTLPNVNYAVPRQADLQYMRA